MVSLACGHAFHRKCVKGWIVRENTRLFNQGRVAWSPISIRASQAACPECQERIDLDDVRDASEGRGRFDLNQVVDLFAAEKRRLMEEEMGAERCCTRQQLPGFVFTCFVLCGAFFFCYWLVT